MLKMLKVFMPKNLYHYQVRRAVVDNWIYNVILQTEELVLLLIGIEFVYNFRGNTSGL